MANSADPVKKPTDLDLHCLQRQDIGVQQDKGWQAHLLPGDVSKYVGSDQTSLW